MRQHVRGWASAPRVGAVGAAMVFGGAMGLRAAPPDYDFDWVTVGAPGNRSANEQEAPNFYPPLSTPAIIAGAVPYEYRMSRTEVTVQQQLEFLNAYFPYFNGFLGDFNITGRWIRAADPHSTNPRYFIIPGAERRPADMDWHTAARFVNWLNNDKRTDRAAFETGAYDASTFTQNADGSWNDQAQHAASARYWLPSLNEWTKAMYYDPNKNGAGAGGYWRYPITSDAAPIPGYPWDGGQTSAGLPWDDAAVWLDVGAYPNVQSPWGLLDGSGGQVEYLEDMDPQHLDHFAKSTWQFYPFPDYFDAIDYIGGRVPNAGGYGFRLASIPGPSTMVFLTLAAVRAARRKRVHVPVSAGPLYRRDIRQSGGC